MTAELFIKLSAQIYHERKRFENFGGLDPVLSHPVRDDESQTFYSGASNIYHTPEQGSADSSENSDGGAKLSRQQSETDLMDFSAPVTQSMSDHQPAGWHADQLQKLNYSDYNPFQLLAERPERNGITEDHKLEQWLPKPESPFWHLYVNKLRVNASEGGICNLSERF
jgi:poly(A)-specific ribonuclease